MNNISQYIEDFFVYLEVIKNQSPKTLQNYRHYLSRFIKYINNNKLTPKDIDLILVNKYRVYLNHVIGTNKKTLSKKTQFYHIVALRVFLKYLAKNDITSLSSEKIELGKFVRKEVEFLTKEEILSMLKAVNRDNIKGKRDYAIMLTLFMTGLRVSELASLRRDKINLEKKEFMVIGKGDKPRIVFINEIAPQVIQEYLNCRIDNNPAMWVSHHKKYIGEQKAKPNKNIVEEMNEALSVRMIQLIIKKYKTKAGIIKEVTPHTLRHSFATTMLQNGADIRSVQELLGHSSITTTQVYTHVTNNKLKEIHEKYMKLD